MEMTLPNVVVVDTVGSFLFQSFVWSKKNLEGIASALYKHLKKEESGTSVAYSFDKLSPPCIDTDTWVLLSFSPLRIRLCL